MRTFGLLGHPLTHSFSKGYFTEKFDQEQILARYLNFDLDNLSQFQQLLLEYPDLEGLNVTIPYKEQVIPLLNELDPCAKIVGAVNVIKVMHRHDQVYLKGYNSDVIGFMNSIRPLLNSNHSRALVLGTGGASKAVVYALSQLGVESHLVSRCASSTMFDYASLTPEIIASYPVIINTTPLGMYPQVATKPLIPYEGITALHVCFDLIYNPEETAFLREAHLRGAAVKNGYEMLIGQALESWRIWNTSIL